MKPEFLENYHNEPLAGIARRAPERNPPRVSRPASGPTGPAFLPRPDGSAVSPAGRNGASKPCANRTDRHRPPAFGLLFSAELVADGHAHHSVSRQFHSPHDSGIERRPLLARFPAASLSKHGRDRTAQGRRILRSEDRGSGLAPGSVSVSRIAAVNRKRISCVHQTCRLSLLAASWREWRGSDP